MIMFTSHRVLRWRQRAVEIDEEKHYSTLAEESEWVTTRKSERAHTVGRVCRVSCREHFAFAWLPFSFHHQQHHRRRRRSRRRQPFPLFTIVRSNDVDAMATNGIERRRQRQTVHNASAEGPFSQWRAALLEAGQMYLNFRLGRCRTPGLLTRRLSHHLIPALPLLHRRVHAKLLCNCINFMCFSAKFAIGVTFLFQPGLPAQCRSSSAVPSDFYFFPFKSAFQKSFCRYSATVNDVTYSTITKITHWLWMRSRIRWRRRSRKRRIKQIVDFHWIEINFNHKNHKLFWLCNQKMKNVLWSNRCDKRNEATGQ